MKKHLLNATAATALLASAGFTFAQKGPDSTGSPAAPSASTSSSGATTHEKVAPGKGGAASTQAMPAAKDKSAQVPHAAGEKMTQAPKVTDALKGADSHMGANNKTDTQSKTQAQAPASSTSTQAQKPSTSTDRNASTESKTNSTASLSNEQRTKIRETVIKQSNAPKIGRSDVKFSLTVGAVVPRSVHVAILPPAVIEIHPAWRGYEYVLVGEEIVILEPGTFRIVAIIPA